MMSRSEPSIQELIGRAPVPGVMVRTKETEIPKSDLMLSYCFASQTEYCSLYIINRKPTLCVSNVNSLIAENGEMRLDKKRENFYAPLRCTDEISKRQSEKLVTIDCLGWEKERILFVQNICYKT